MLPQKSPVQVIEHADIEVCIYRVQQGYRVAVNGTGTEFYWHPGIFVSVQELSNWLQPQLELLLYRGLALAGEWMSLEEDFDDNQMYRDWFINKTAQEWQGYDPLTNRCYTASSLQVLKGKIDQIELNKS